VRICDRLEATVLLVGNERNALSAGSIGYLNDEVDCRPDRDGIGASERVSDGVTDDPMRRICLEQPIEALDPERRIPDIGRNERWIAQRRRYDAWQCQVAINPNAIERRRELEL
jgi:hypothetical protein